MTSPTPAAETVLAEIIAAPKYYCDADGRYIGSFEGVLPPPGATECPTAPQSAEARWVDDAWVEPDPPAPVLDAPRFEYLLAFTGLDDVWDALFSALRVSDRAAYAALKAQRAKGAFHLDVTLALVETYRTQAELAAPEADLSAETIKSAWMQAAGVEI